MKDTQFDDVANVLGGHEIREVHAMETGRFDRLTRTLAAPGSRRRALATALAAGLFAALGGRGVGAANDSAPSRLHRALRQAPC